MKQSIKHLCHYQPDFEKLGVIDWEYVQSGLQGERLYLTDCDQDTPLYYLNKLIMSYLSQQGYNAKLHTISDIYYSEKAEEKLLELTTIFAEQRLKLDPKSRLGTKFISPTVLFSPAVFIGDQEMLDWVIPDCLYIRISK